MDAPTTPSKPHFIKTLYLYLVSFVALMMIVISAVDLIQIVLKSTVFTKADANLYGYPVPPCVAPVPGDTSTVRNSPCGEAFDSAKQDADNRDAQRQRDLVRDIAMLLVGSPLFYFHWRLARRKE